MGGAKSNLAEAVAEIVSNPLKSRAVFTVCIRTHGPEQTVFAPHPAILDTTSGSKFFKF